MNKETVYNRLENLNCEDSLFVKRFIYVFLRS